MMKSSPRHLTAGYQAQEWTVELVMWKFSWWENLMFAGVWRESPKFVTPFDPPFTISGLPLALPPSVLLDGHQQLLLRQALMLQRRIPFAETMKHPLNKCWNTMKYREIPWILILMFGIAATINCSNRGIFLWSSIHFSRLLEGSQGSRIANRKGMVWKPMSLVSPFLHMFNRASPRSEKLVLYSEFNARAVLNCQTLAFFRNAAFNSSK